MINNVGPLPHPNPRAAAASTHPRGAQPNGPLPTSFSLFSTESEADFTRDILAFLNSASVIYGRFDDNKKQLLEHVQPGLQKVLGDGPGLTPQDVQGLLASLENQIGPDLRQALVDCAQTRAALENAQAISKEKMPSCYILAVCFLAGALISLALGGHLAITATLFVGLFVTAAVIPGILHGRVVRCEQAAKDALGKTLDKSFQDSISLEQIDDPARQQSVQAYAAFVKQSLRALRANPQDWVLNASSAEGGLPVQDHLFFCDILGTEQGLRSAINLLVALKILARKDPVLQEPLPDMR